MNADTGSTREVSLREHLLAGQVIPAHPLALTASRQLDEEAQRSLTRYYVEAGAGGIAVGVHTTQFEIRRPDVGLFRPVLELAAEEAKALTAASVRPFLLVAGICGHTAQARTEAETAVALGYDLGLLSLGAWRQDAEDEILLHVREIAQVIPIFGFYLQPAVGGRRLSYRFWREFVEIPGVWAIKVAPFNRYASIDVVRATVESDRTDIALYTGNDDNIVNDLVTPVPATVGGRVVARWMDGGLLGQWAVWTRAAVRALDQAKAARESGLVPASLLQLGAALTAANAAIFDVANDFAGCIPGIHEVLRREGLMEGTWCLDPNEVLSPGQADEITRVMREYPELRDY